MNYHKAVRNNTVLKGIHVGMDVLISKTSPKWGTVS